MEKKLGRKFWSAMLIFGLIGQVAWVVENMYFNVFLYKMFHASAADISLMVAASAVSATLTTILMGALSDKLGRRKLFICLGYLVWGITILSFAFIRMDVLTPLAGSTAAAFSLGITLVILMDCVMTFFGSTANDAAYNAWLTDRGDETNRGKIEGFNAMMPLVSILVVFGGFMGFDLDLAGSWTTIFLVIGTVVTLIGVLGFFLIQEAPGVRPVADPYWRTVAYSFRPKVLRANPLLYAVLGGFALFGVSIQIFMPYLILYYEQSLGMANYVLVMAPAIVLAAVVTAFYGRVYDRKGFRASAIPSVAALMAGYVLLYLFRATLPVFLGSLLMMTGYMTGMSVFGAMIRDHIPQGRAGQFQGIRIIGQVLLPGIVGPAIGAWVLRDAEQIVNSDGTTSFLPNRGIWLAALVAAVVLCVALALIFRMRQTPTGHGGGGGRPIPEGEPWPEHPRPQLRRECWASLDGVWQLNGRPIRVPFPPQAPLSGYTGPVGDVLTYETTFTVPERLRGDRLLIHFGAVDQTASVFLNGQLLGESAGGYLPFALDATDALCEGENRLTVRAVDTLSPHFPYGKQCRRPHGMWYTPVSGIWQSVWLERVPQRYIRALTLTPGLTGVDIALEGEFDGFCVHVDTPAGGQDYTFTGLTGHIAPDDPLLWTPERPHLYPITVTAGEDRVASYFALRTVSVEEREGVARVCLNGKPIFLHGVLDQGYFHDGLYLPACPEEYGRDVARMKELGFNLLRKHLKVEPEHFYYACDRLGMLVMQDMVNSGRYSFLKHTVLPTLGLKRLGDEGRGDRARQEYFLSHMEGTARHLYNHPCIVAYTIFNEGWGQFRADDAYLRLRKADQTRLIDATSGWFAQRLSDFDSQHIYFKLRTLSPGRRPLLVSECGGYTLSAAGHDDDKPTYGYGKCRDSGELTEKLLQLYRQMILPAVSKGVCGCIYTQLSDVEGEINGLYTYDRAVRKVDPAPLQALAAQLQAEVL